MNKNKSILVEIIDNFIKNDPMYSDIETQEEITNYITTCIEGIANSAWVSSKRASDLVRRICQSYVSALDNPPPKVQRTSKFD